MGHRSSMGKLLWILIVAFILALARVKSQKLSEKKLPMLPINFCIRFQTIPVNST